MVSEVVRDAAEDCNLNSLNIFASDFDADDQFDDDSEGDENCPGDTSEDKLRLINAIVAKRLQSIPKIDKQPSPLVKYLLFSNVCSLLYYLRQWNGNLLVGEHMPLDQGLNVAEALVTQLLSKNSQYKVQKDSLASAYMLDYVYFVGLFQKRTGRVND